MNDLNGSRGSVLLIDHPAGKRDDRLSRRLCESGYEVRWCCPGKGEALPEPDGRYRGAVAYGGPESVNDLEAYPYLAEEIRWIERWVAADKPFFGICLGGQMLARALGAEVTRHPEGVHEIGYVEIEATSTGNGFLPEKLFVYHWHNEGFTCPKGAELLASGPVFPNQAYRYGSNAYGIQFHPEVTRKVIERWTVECDPAIEERPGAHPASRQLADCARFDAALDRWCSQFLNDWLAD